jgi:hypothetical protein
LTEIGPKTPAGGVIQFNSVLLHHIDDVEFNLIDLSLEPAGCYLGSTHLKVGKDKRVRHHPDQSFAPFLN